MTAQNSSKGLNVSLWIAQGLLATIYIMAGSIKTFQAIEALTQMLPWVDSVPSELVRFIGISELAGGIGLILPALLRIKPELTPIAALGLVAIQVLAILFHVSRGESSVIGINITLLAIAAFIAWGRFFKAVIFAKASRHESSL